MPCSNRLRSPHLTFSLRERTSSCAKDAEKANIVLLSPFYLENGEIKAEFVNAGDIRLTDYIKSNVSFETEDMEENYCSETEILSPETGENRFRLHFSGGEVYILTIKNIAADELFAAVKGDGIFENMKVLVG